MTNSLKFYDQVDKWLAAMSKPRQMVHFRRTVYWLKQLQPEADEPMLIAALAHDTERVFHGSVMPKKGENLHESEYLKNHQDGGAEIVGDFLQKQGASQLEIERVKMLISKHEEGGTDDQNLIKDADSISFFENNIEHFLNNLIGKYGKQNVRDKFQWMFGRITLEKAKAIVYSWYTQAIKSLENN